MTKEQLNARSLVIIIFSLSFFSCKTNQEIKRSSETTLLHGSISSLNVNSIDSLLESITRQVVIVSAERIRILDYYENVPGDTIPRLKSVTEIEKNTQQAENELIEKRESNKTNHSFISRDSLFVTANKNEQDIIKNDSRPVQGVEWLWVIASVGIVVLTGLIILFWYLRRKRPP